jgi:hypothetical protein
MELRACIDTRYSQLLKEGLHILLDSPFYKNCIDARNLLGPDMKLRWFCNPDEGRETIPGTSPFSPKTYCHLPAVPKHFRLDPPTPPPMSAQPSLVCRPSNPPRFGTIRWIKPPKKLQKLVYKAIKKFEMIRDGDRGPLPRGFFALLPHSLAVLACISGGKDSLSMLHLLKNYQDWISHRGIRFELAAATVDPGTGAHMIYGGLTYRQE